MTGQYYAGAYWGGRRESAEACAQRLRVCLADLAELDGALREWYRTASTGKAGPVPLHTDVDSLRALLGSGRDAELSTIDELGFSVALWNGDARRPIGLRMTCGAFATRVSNVFTLQLPDDELCTWLPWPSARRLLEIIVSAFEPEWATLTSHEWRRAQGAAPGQPVIGWLTYLAHAPVRTLTPESSSVPFADGVLLSAGAQCDDTLGDRVQGLAASLNRDGFRVTGP